MAFGGSSRGFTVLASSTRVNRGATWRDSASVITPCLYAFSKRRLGFKTGVCRLVHLDIGVFHHRPPFGNFL